MKLRNAVVWILLGTLVAGCGTPTYQQVNFPRLAPPPEAGMANVDRIIVGPFTGVQGAGQLREDIRRTLINSRQYEVIGGPLGFNGIGGTTDFLEQLSGDWTDRDIILTCEVVEFNYRERLTEEETKPDESGKKPMEITRHGTAVLSANFSLTRIASHDSVAVFNLYRTVDAEPVKKIGGLPPAIDSEVLLDEVQSKVVEAFVGRILSRQVDERVHFRNITAETDESTLVGPLVAAYRYLNAGDYDGAISHLERLVSIRPQDPASHYNLALGLALNGQYEPALEVLSQARELDQDGMLAEDITTARHRIREWQEDATLVDPR